MQRNFASGCAEAAASRVRAPISGVLLHDLEFFAGEPAGLEQDAVGDAHFADVVQRAGHVDELHVVAVDLIAKLGLPRQMLGDHPAVFPHPLQVRRRFPDRGIRRVSPC